MAKYLRQLKTGAIYVYTDLLAKRRDMVPYDSAQAKARMGAIKTMLLKRQPNLAEGEIVAAEAAQIKAEAMELTGLEATLEANESAEAKAIEDATLPEEGKKLSDETPLTTKQAAEKLKQETLEENPKYKKAMGLKSRNDVEEYMLLEFGQEIEISRPFKDLKEYAVEKTANRILEG